MLVVLELLQLNRYVIVYYVFVTFNLIFIVSVDSTILVYKIEFVLLSFDDLRWGKQPHDGKQTT